MIDWDNLTDGESKTAIDRLLRVVGEKSIEVERLRAQVSDYMDICERPNDDGEPQANVQAIERAIADLHQRHEQLDARLTERLAAVFRQIDETDRALLAVKNAIVSLTERVALMAPTDADVKAAYGLTVDEPLEDEPLEDDEPLKGRLSVRTVNALKAAGIETANRLRKLSTAELLEIPKLGKTALVEIDDYLTNRAP